MRIKADFERLETKLFALSAQVDAKIAQLDGKIDTRVAELKADIIRWVFGIAVAQAGLILAVLRLFPVHP